MHNLDDEGSVNPDSAKYIIPILTPPLNPQGIQTAGKRAS